MGNACMQNSDEFKSVSKDFQAPLGSIDPELANLITKETQRQETGLELIPSENFVPESILQACGSILTNKYAEGLPGKRYYGGCECVDEVEVLAQERAKKLFGAEYTNVQPHSGAGANQAVYEGLLKPGDVVMGMRLDMGGHLTHGSPVNFSGKHYKIVAYGVREDNHLIDLNEVRELAKQHNPKLIICGATAYSRHIDFEGFRKIADEVGALLMADIAHYAGLVAAGEYPSPVKICDIVTSTTHKTLRGPRSGFVMSKEIHGKAIDKAVFPGLQGGPHMHTIAAKALTFKLAGADDFKVYAKQVISNARALSAALIEYGYKIVSGGTDSHVMLVDLRPFKITGKAAEACLGKVAITCNKNTIPYDPEGPFIGSGIRLGTPALTTRGMKEPQMKEVARLIHECILNRESEQKLIDLKNQVKELSLQFPLYGYKLI